MREDDTAASAASAKRCAAPPRRRWHRLLPLTIVTAAVIALPAGMVAAETKLMVKSGDWSAHSHEAGTTRTCFAVSSGQRPPSGGAVSRVLVSAWPKDGVKAEISIKLGVPPRQGSSVEVTVDAARFKLFVRDDRAFVADAAQELKLLDAMRKGATLALETVSEDGTAGKETISLKGLTQALQAIALCK